MQKKYLIIFFVLFIIGYLGIHAVRAQTIDISPTISIEPSPIPTNQSDYFLKIDGIPGESTDEKHKDEIEILSFKWGESQRGATQSSGGASSSGKVNMQDFHFVMKFNKASPKLFLSCASGEHFQKAVLIVRKAGKDDQEYLKWTLSDVVCSSYQTAGSNPQVPNDQFSLNFNKIEVEYKPQKADGTLDSPVKAGWDLKKNKPLP